MLYSLVSILGLLFSLAQATRVYENTYFREQYNSYRTTQLSTNQPRLCDKNSYSGYFSADANHNYFFWFFEARNNPSTAPLILWLTGGPGCSSMLALLVENGPCYVNEQASDTYLSATSWTEAANVVWVDQPPGTGFSTGTVDTTEDEIAEDMYAFLLNFMGVFPSYFNNGLYVFGESYAGHYIPAISANIVKQAGLEIKFNGLAIGNGLMSVYWQYPQYATFALENNLVDQKTYNSLVTGFKLCDSLIKQGLYSLALVQCQTQVNRILGNPPKFNVYDIREPCEHLPLCYDLSFVDDFLEQPAVEQALGVSGRPWSECNDTVHTDLSADWMTDFTDTMGTLVKSGLKILIYHGDKDFICNWRGGETFSNNIPWDGSADFNKLSYTKWEDYGEYRHLDNLTFLRIYNAGHMVPMDQPVAAERMLDKFIAGWQ